MPQPSIETKFEFGGDSQAEVLTYRFEGVMCCIVSDRHDAYVAQGEVC